MRYPTEPEEPSRAWTRFEQGLRLAAYAVVFGILVAAVLGFTGLRTRDSSASNGDLRVTVTYGQITRPGIATPFEIDIASASSGPLPEELQVEVSSDYLAMFDENGLDPEPDATTANGTIDTWTYLPDDQQRLHIDFDARLQPNIHSGETATVSVSGSGIEPVTVRARTWVLP